MFNFRLNLVGWFPSKMVFFRTIVDRSWVLLVESLNGLLVLINMSLVLLFLDDGSRIIYQERRLSCCREALSNSSSNLMIFRDFPALVKVTLRIDITSIRVHKIPISIVLPYELSLLRLHLLFYLRLCLIIGRFFVRTFYIRRFCFYLI